MAARNRAKDLQAVVNCSICLDYFNDPVILKCGHNFCRSCITRHCESADFMDISPPSWPCPRPLCGEAFGEGDLQPNPHLRNIIDIAKKIPEPGGRRACKEHGELLKLFCEVDQTPICLLCRESRSHKEHRVAPADEAAQDYKAQIQSHLDTLKKEREEIQLFKLSEENECQKLLKQLKTEKQKIVSEFQQLRQFLEEQERLLLAQLEELNKEIEKWRDEYVAKLSEVLSSFSSLISEMEQKCQQPASEFLQDIKGTLSRCKREKFQNPVAHSSELKSRIRKSLKKKKNAALEIIVKKFKAELRSLAPQSHREGGDCESPREQHRSSYLRHRSSSHRPSPLRRLPAPRLWEQSSPMATVSHQSQAWTSLSGDSKRDISGMEREFSPLLMQHQHDWAPEAVSTSMMPFWQLGQWPAKRSLWSIWDMPVMPMYPLLHSSAVTSQQKLASPSSVPKAHSEAGVEERAPTLKPPPSMGDDAPGPPL